MSNMSDVILLLFLMFNMLVIKGSQSIRRPTRKNIKEMTLKVSVFAIIAICFLWGFQVFYLIRGNHG